MGCEVFTGPVRPLAPPAGVAVVDEPPFVQRFEDIDDSVMHDPVVKRGRADQAQLGVADPEVVIRTGPPCSGGQFLL
jgi:hypothetical protein